MAWLLTAETLTENDHSAPTCASAPSVRSPRDRGVWPFVITGLLVRLGLSLYMLDRPGLQYDEVNFVNAADARIGSTFIHSRLGGVPTMVMAYAGALKSWLYTPVFAILKPSAVSVRSPVVVITCLALAALFAGLRSLVGTATALLAFVLLCFDPSVFWLTRLDVGPVAIEFSLKCLAVLLAARWVTRRDIASVLAMVAVLAAGVFNKLNFIWYVNAALVVSVVLVVAHWKAIGRDSLRQLAVWFSGLGAIYAVWGWWFSRNDLGATESGLLARLPGAWLHFRYGMGGVLSGTWYHDYALGSLAPRWWVFWVLAGLFVVGLGAAARSGERRQETVLAMTACTGIVCAQILLTEQATAGWHYMGVLPFATIVVAHGVTSLGGRGRALPAIALTVGIAFVAYDANLLRKSFQAVRNEPANVAWTPQIYELSNYVEHRTAKVVSLDWGIQTPLLALDASDRYEELAQINREPAGLASLRAFLAGERPGTLAVLHGAGKEVFAGSRSRALDAMGGGYDLERRFASRSGETIFEVWRKV